MMLQTGKVSKRFEEFLMNGSDEMLDYFNTNIIPNIEFAHILQKVNQHLLLLTIHTPSPTPTPAPFPTQNSTPAPTFLFCEEIDYDSSLVVVASNGFHLNGNDGRVITEFLNDLMETLNVYDEKYVDFKIIQHAFGSIQVLSQTSRLSCSHDNLNVDYIEYEEYDGSLHKAYQSCDLENKTVFISLCCNEEYNNGCGTQWIRDLNQCW